MYNGHHIIHLNCSNIYITGAVPMFLMRFGERCDESKFDLIESLAECRNAFSNLISTTYPASRSNGVRVKTSSNYPKGCYYDKSYLAGGWQTYFNNHASGRRNRDATQVCKLKGTIVILYVR